MLIVMQAITEGVSTIWRSEHFAQCAVDRGIAHPETFGVALDGQNI